MGNDPITNASTGVTPEQLGGSGPSTDLSTQGMPAGTTRVENGVAYDASGKALGPVGGAQAAPVTPPAKPKFDPNAPIELSSPAPTTVAPAKPKFDPSAPIQVQGEQAAPLQDDRGAIHKLWDWVNKGLVSKDTIVDLVQRASATGQYEDVVTRGYKPQVDVPGFGRIDLNTLQKGITDSASGVLSSFTSPLSIALFGAGGVAGNAGKAVQTARAATAVKTADAAVAATDAALTVRIGEAANAAKQADEAQKLLEAAKAAEQAGTGSKAATIAAQERASAAAANSMKAQEALEAAKATKAVNSVKAAQAARDLEKATQASKTLAGRTLGKLSPGAGKAARIASRAAGVGFGAAGASEALTPQEEGETLADSLERRLQGAGFGILGATGEVAGREFAQAPIGEIPSRVGEAYEQWHADREARKQAEAVTGISDKAIAAKKDFMKAIPPTKAAPYDSNDYEIARNYLEYDHHTDLERGGGGVDGIEATRDAFENQRQGIENKVSSIIRESYGNEPIATNVKQDVIEALGGHEKAGFLEAGLDALAPYNLIDPTMAEADRIRKQLNDENRGTLRKNSWDVATALSTDPEFAARYHAAESLRNGIYNKLEEMGVKGAREMRQDESVLIRMRNAADRQIYNGEKMVRGTSEVSGIRKVLSKGAKVAGAGIGAYVGGSVAGTIGAEGGAIAGAYLGDQAARAIAPPDLTRDALLQRSMGEKVATGAPGQLDMSTAHPSNPPVEATPPKPREHTPLHAELATHYGETIGDSDYQDLEDRFKSDIQLKRQHGVPLETSEKSLLNKINQTDIQDIADRNAAIAKAKEDALKAHDEAQEKPQPAGRSNVLGSIVHGIGKAVERIQRTPASRLFGHSDETALGHEWGHAAQAAIENIAAGDISSHLHEESDNGAYGGIQILDRPFVEDPKAEEKYTPKEIFENTKKHLRINMAGAAVNEILHGIPPEANAGLESDISQNKAWLRAHGIEGDDADLMIENAYNEVKKNLEARPEVLEAIRQNTHFREEGLSKDLHASTKRVKNFQELVKGINNENKTGKSDKGVNGGGEKEPVGGNEGGDKGAGKGGGTENRREVGAQGGHAGGGVASEEELARPGRFVKISRSGLPTDQNKVPDFNLRPGEAGYQVTKEGPKLVAGEESAQTKRGAEAYHKEVFGRANLRGGSSDLQQGWITKEGKNVPLENNETHASAVGRIWEDASPLEEEGLKRGAIRVHVRDYVPGVPTELSFETQTLDKSAKERIGQALLKAPEGTKTVTVGSKAPYGHPDRFQEMSFAEALDKFAPSKRSNLRGTPPEKTTGSPETDEAIRAGGGVPGGKFGDLAMFHHPNGTTLAMRPEGITPESVREHIGKKTEEYTQGDLRNAARAINPNFNPESVAEDPRSSEIADAYKAAVHEPNNPAVKASYDALKRDIDSQYNLLKNQGFDLETAKENPYGLSSEIPAHEELHRDVLRNKHLAVWEGGAPPADHPLSERDPKTGLTYNDKFRMVHDVFGHAAERTDFSPAGEESAWNLHRQLFSPEARPALATETRGQAAYTYKYGDFPPQKATILPEHLQVRPEDLGKRSELRGAQAAEPTLSDRLVETFGTTEDPRDAGFILNDGRMVPLHDTHNTMLDTLYNKYGDIGINDAERTAFINNENAVRTRYRTDKGGQEVVFSVPKNGVNEEQIQRMRQSVGKIRNGNAVMEIAEPNGGKSVKKEFARPSDIDPMLREIGAHPDSKSWVPDITKQVAGGVNPENPEAGSKRYGFEIHPESRQTLEANPTADDFQKYADQTKEIRQAHPDIKLGWDTTGEKPELNIGASTDDRQLAEEMARKLDQRSIYDTKEDKVIPTGGTGTKTEFPEYPFEQRLADLNTGRSELRGKTLSPKAQKMIDKVKEESYATYPLDEVKSGDPWISPAEKEAGGKPGLDHSDAGFLHPDGSISLIESAYMHDPFLAALGDDFDHDKFIKTTGSGTFDMFDDRGNGNSSNPKTFSLTLGNKPTPQQVEAIAAMTKHLREGSPDFQTVDVSWPGSHKTIDFATPGKVIQELGSERSELRGKPADVKKAQDTTEVHPEGSSVVLRENPLPVKPSPGNDIPSTVDVAMALNKYTKKSIGSLELGKAEPQEMVDRAKSLAEDEARYQLAQNNTGAAWYTTQMADHDRILQGMRPETKDPAKLSIFKMAEAILSSGQKPYANFKTTVRAWDQYQETGKFPAFNPDTKKSWGPRGIPAYGNAFESLNRLIQEHGEKGASDWLLSEHPVGELKEYNPNVKGKKDDMQLGAMILGPKRGPFAQNLHGLESAFTADMWVARTWHRWMGTAEIAPDGELATDRPRSDKERELMKKSFAETADRLGMTTSSLQAVLWYYEQALYSAHGSPKESWSFSDAAQRVADDEASTFNFGHNRSELRGGPQAAAPKTYSVPAGWTETGPTKAPGLVTPGNINLTTRPVVKNDDGTTSSEYSTSFQDDKGREVLVPTVVDGKFLTPDGKKPKPGSPEEKAMFQKAWQHYEQTGEHLGIYDTPEHADAAAQQIHNRPPVSTVAKSGLDKLAGK